MRGLPVLLQYRAELGGEWLGRMSFTAPAAAAKQGGMRQGAVLLGRCSLPQNGCSLINPVLNMPVNSRSQPGFCGLWHRCCRQQVQAILAAAGSPPACPSMQLALPLCGDGNHSSAHGLSEMLCPSSLGDSLTPSMGESLARHPQWGGQNSLCLSLMCHTPPPSTPPPSSARPGRVLACIAGWYQCTHCSGTRAGLFATHLADAALFIPLHTVPKPRRQQLG